MLEIKLLEVRDACTFIPVMAIRCNDPMLLPIPQSYLVSRAGWHTSTMLYIIVLGQDRCAYDSYQWRGDTRTMPNAHKYIEANWNSLKDGDVVDVEFILGEKPEKKISERLEGY